LPAIQAGSLVIASIASWRHIRLSPPIGTTSHPSGISARANVG
jgi:hypothetical protein